MRTAFASLAFASLALAACGDDGGDDRADASITIRPDAAVDASTDEPDADVDEPDADVGEPDAMVEPGEARLILSEVLEGDLTGGLPKFAEITNTGGAAADLSAYSIGTFNNGNTTLSGTDQTSFALAGTLEPGDSYVVTFDQSGGGGATHMDVYGEAADLIITETAFNGDDAIVLFEGIATGDGSDATIVDIYGVIGVDGSGSDWEYSNSYGVRRPAFVEPTDTFDVNQWVVNPVDTLDGATAEEHDAASSPGLHSFEK